MTRWNRSTRLALLVIGSLASSAVAQPAAQPSKQPTQHDLASARSYFQDAEAAKARGDYQTAANEYLLAHDLFPDPEFFFDIGEVYRLAGDEPDALNYYQKYLDLEPNGRGAEAARNAVDELRRSIAAKPDAAKRAGDDEAKRKAAEDARRRSDEDAAKRAGDDEAKRKAAEDARRRSDEDADASTPEPGRAATTVGTSLPANGHDEVVTSSSSKATAALAASERERRKPWTLAHIGGGASVVQRDLNYDMRSGFLQRPPQVRTTAGALRIEGEIYALSGLGVAAIYDKTLDHNVQPTGSSVLASVNQAHYDVGLRYQHEILDSTTMVLGFGYVHRHYLIDRSNLKQPLDVPNVSYQAIAPMIGVRLQVATPIIVFAAINGMLILDAGPIQNPDSYGGGFAYGIEASSGAEYIMSRRFHVYGRLAAEYSHIAVAFDDGNIMTAGRDAELSTKDINGAIDQSITVTLTIGLGY
jgi:tetratricopeptide (TPR) repeat protein